MQTPKDPQEEFRAGADVFQITYEGKGTEGKEGWVGAFVLAAEIKPWGIQGFVHHIETRDCFKQAFIRLSWEDIEYVGRATLVRLSEPEDENAD